MAIIAKQENESGFSPIPEGVHTAVCYGIVDLGDQYSEKFDKVSRKVIIMWELPHELIEKDGEPSKPRVISKEYTLSLGDKATLRKDLQAWRGKVFTDEELQGFDLKNILSKGCQIQIIHKENNGKTYANIASIMSLAKGMKAEEPVNPIVYFDLTEEGILARLETLPGWIIEKIKLSNTYKELAATDGFIPVDSEDDLPF